jgi:cytochrome c oxidase assembly protein subunit 15
MRVRLDERLLALSHACLGLATFAVAAGMAVVTSQYWWQRTVGAIPGEERLHSSSGGKQAAQELGLMRWAVATAGLIYLQVILGALVRHVPVGASHSFFRIAVLLHVAVAMLILLHVGVLSVRTWLSARHISRLWVPMAGLMVLVIAQMGLGAATWVLRYGWPAWFGGYSMAAGYTVQANSLQQATVTTLHVALGALILALEVVVALRTWLFFPRNAARWMASLPMHEQTCSPERWESITLGRVL